MLNWRLYRVAFVPFVFALAVAAFSLGRRPLPVTSTLAPDAFQGARAYAELQRLQAEFPTRRPGSPADNRLAGQIANTLRQFGGAHGGGFSVRIDRFSAQTIDGERRLSTVIAERPGSTSETPLLIVAHRDAALSGSEAELSGTAALLELARVFAARETKRTIVLASTSGGSGGDAGATRLASQLHGSFDAAIVLGDVAGRAMRAPAVVPFSDGQGSAPLQLQRTVADAITHEAGVDPGAPSTLGQLVHLAFPLALGEQGVLNAGGIPAVLVQVSGERGPSRHAPVSAGRLESFGRAVLSALDALDAAPDISPARQTGVLLQRQTMPAWALRLLALTLLFPPLITVADGFARLRRRRMPVRRWLVWTLTCALPFFSCAVLAYLLGWLGILGAAPAVPALASAMPLDGQAAAAVGAVALTFALAWLLWVALVRRLQWGAHPDHEVAGLSAMIVLVVLAVIVWLVNPLCALVLVPALHLWLVLAAPETRPRRIPSLLLLVAPVLPLAAVVAFYGHQLQMGPGALAWTGVQLLAGGHVGVLGAVLWSAAFGCLAAIAMLALRAPAAPSMPRGTGRVEVTIRGPMSYAGPGSLGGTESALRR